jgi:hypothetical protein
MAIWDSAKQATVRVSDNLVVRSYGNSEAQAVEELRRYAGLERLAEWERQTGKALKVEAYSGKKRGVLIEYDRAVDAPKEASLEVRRKPSDTALPIPGKVAEKLEAQGVSVRGEGVTVRRTEQGLRIDVAPGARNVSININMAELPPTGKDASPGRRTEFDDALQKAQREANAYDRELGLSAPTPEKPSLRPDLRTADGRATVTRSVRFEEQVRAFATGQNPFPERLPAYLLRPAMAEAEGGEQRVRALENLEHYHPDMMRRWREVPEVDRAALVDGIRERRQGRQREVQEAPADAALRQAESLAQEAKAGRSPAAREIEEEERAIAESIEEAKNPQKEMARGPSDVEETWADLRNDATWDGVRSYEQQIADVRETRDVATTHDAGPSEWRIAQPNNCVVASQLGELGREVQADANMRQSVVQSDRREDVAEEQLSEVGGGRTRVEAPDPTIGKGVATQVAGMAPVPTAGASPEWRGTITEALQEVRGRHGDVAFASGDWQRHSRVRVYTARELTDTVERVRDLIEPEKNEVKAYTVKPDGTIHNVVTNRDEFVALSGQAFQVRPDLEARLEREKAQQATVSRAVERKGSPEISVGNS